MLNRRKRAETIERGKNVRERERRETGGGMQSWSSSSSCEPIALAANRLLPVSYVRSRSARYFPIFPSYNMTLKKYTNRPGVCARSKGKSPSNSQAKSEVAEPRRERGKNPLNGGKPGEIYKCRAAG